jgi:hypothetical protein
VQEKLPKPPVIRHQAEMLYKYMLLLGVQEFDDRFDVSAPINPSTKKPFGEETQKFANWAKIVKQDGKIPVHPSSYDIAKTVYVHTMDQVNAGTRYRSQSTGNTSPISR